jgi:hypothetical protein
MSTLDQYLLGDRALYARVCLVTEVLGKFVSSAPRAVDLAQLEKQTGKPARELLKLCTLLCSEGLLLQHQPRQWTLACEASSVTLEDAFRCVFTEQATRARPGRPKTEAAAADTPRRDVDLLVMQATMGIQQGVFKHLRQFSLDRLKVGTPGMFAPPGPNAWPRLSFS